MQVPEQKRQDGEQPGAAWGRAPGVGQEGMPALPLLSPTPGSPLSPLSMLQSLDGVGSTICVEQPLCPLPPSPIPRAFTGGAAGKSPPSLPCPLGQVLQAGLVQGSSEPCWSCRRGANLLVCFIRTRHKGFASRQGSLSACAGLGDAEIPSGRAAPMGDTILSLCAGEVRSWDLNHWLCRKSLQPREMPG